jgi:hypothetical protein
VSTIRLVLVSSYQVRRELKRAFCARRQLLLGSRYLDQFGGRQGYDHRLVRHGVSRLALIRHCDTLELTFTMALSWKLPFALQWIWPVPLFIMACFVPQSPWWLVRQGRYQDAERSVARLTDAEHYSELEVKQSVAMMIHTTEMEKQTTAGASYIDCFRGVDRRRSEIAMMVFAG